jgi:carboxyl-terminal processing protease
MNEQRKGSLQVWTPLLFSLVMIVGMIFGFDMRDTLRNKRDIQSVMLRNDRLEEIIDLVHEKYADTINANQLYKDAIGGILKHLDPHTVYIPADEVQGVNEDLEGGFFGIGVEFLIVRDTIQVISVIENGPAEKAGMVIGDQLLKVGDSIVAGKKITSEGIIQMLRGKQYSSVILTLKEPGRSKEKQVAIIRNTVPIYSIDADLKIDSNTGFIKINRFSATTYDEFYKALKKLKEQGITQLIVDLRDNPGGYLEAATSVADEFLDDNKLLVYTQGLHTPKTEYKAGKKGLFETGKLAILVDESSASASEILSGAIQDWDRGIIVGRRTYGKGLVQEQFDMEDGAALRLTVAKYYTPAGRCIQRPFDKGKEAYAQDFEKRFEDGELTGTDTATSRDTTRYYTSKHRLVRGGGGISPDVHVPYDTSRFSAALLNIVFSDDLRSVIWDYFIHNKAGFSYKNIEDYNAQFNDEDNVIKNYLDSLKPADKAGVMKILKKPGNATYFKMQVKAQMARFLFRENGYYAISVKDDNVVKKALEIMNSNEYLKLINGQ